jgi:hypothetical protein
MTSVVVSELDQWVGLNNIPTSFEYGRAWWDYIEVIRRLGHKFEIGDIQVVGHYIVDTPPPRERLPMPAVALRDRGVTVALKYDFGRMRQWPLEWTVSVRRRSAYLGPIFGLFDPTLDLRREHVEGLQPDFVFGPYEENPAEFTCELTDEWDLATLMRLVFHEP